MDALQWQVLLAAEHQVWQLDRLSGHLSLPQSSAGVPAGFLKCELQLQCETHPFALLFFFLPPSCLNSVSRVSVKLLDSKLFCLCLIVTGDTSCTGRQTSAPACFWSFLCQTACSWQVGAGGYYQNLSNILCLLDNSLLAVLQLWYVCSSSSGSL